MGMCRMLGAEHLTSTLLIAHVSNHRHYSVPTAHMRTLRPTQVHMFAQLETGDLGLKPRQPDHSSLGQRMPPNDYREETGEAAVRESGLLFLRRVARVYEMGRQTSRQKELHRHNRGTAVWPSVGPALARKGGALPSGPREP